PPAPWKVSTSGETTADGSPRAPSSYDPSSSNRSASTGRRAGCARIVSRPLPCSPRADLAPLGPLLHLHLPQMAVAPAVTEVDDEAERQPDEEAEPGLGRQREHQDQ